MGSSKELSHGGPGEYSTEVDHLFRVKLSARSESRPSKVERQLRQS